MLVVLAGILASHLEHFTQQAGSPQLKLKKDLLFLKKGLLNF
jgi:hypothetical protein